MSLVLQTRWVCNTCKREWVPPGPWSPVMVFTPEMLAYVPPPGGRGPDAVEWDQIHCVNPFCYSTDIEPRAYVGDRGTDVPRNPDGSFGGFVGTSASISGLNDVAGLLPDPARHPSAMRAENQTLLLAEAAEAAAQLPPPADDWVRDGSPYDLSEMD